MERSRKFEIISGIATRLDEELQQLKAFIKLEFADFESGGTKSKPVKVKKPSKVQIQVDNVNVNDESHKQTRPSRSKPPRQIPVPPLPPDSPPKENAIFKFDPQILIDNMGIKSENYEEEPDDPPDLSSFYTASMSIEEYENPYQPFVVDEHHLQQQIDQEPTTSFKKPKSNGKLSRSGHGHGRGYNHADSALRKLISKVIRKEKASPKFKKLSKMCPICRQGFETNALLKEHQQIHYIVPRHHTFVESQRGNPLLDADGYLYRKTTGTSRAIYWQCGFRENGINCLARATSSLDGERVRLTGEHNHQKKTRKSFKNRNSIESVKEILSASAMAKLSTNPDQNDQNNQKQKNSHRSHRRNSQTSTAAEDSKNKIEVIIAKDEVIDEIYNDDYGDDYDNDNMDNQDQQSSSE